jgi:acyl carrier protein
MRRTSLLSGLGLVICLAAMVTPRTVRAAVTVGEVEQRVHKVVAKELKADQDKLTRATNLRKDLGMDDLDAVELVMALEAEFGINIPDTESEKFKTVGDVIDCVSRLVKAEKETAVPSPDTGLVGTRWQFPGTTTTIEFLEGGRFLWNGQQATGTWKQEGNSVTINVNDFTLFELTMNGDEMTGTWHRLQGEEAGKKYPSGLRRLQD